MSGAIRPRGMCIECGSQFEYITKLGFIRPNCRILPTRFVYDFYYKSKRIRIYSDKQGKPLDTYNRAKDVQKAISAELVNHNFDPSKYVKAELEQFYCSALLDRFLNDKLPGLAPSYKTDYKRMVSRAKFHFSTKDVRYIRKLDIINYKNHLTNTHKLADKTLKNHMDLFKTFMWYCMSEFEVIDRVPPFPSIDVKDPLRKT